MSRSALVVRLHPAGRVPRRPTNLIGVVLVLSSGHTGIEVLYGPSLLE